MLKAPTNESNTRSYVLQKALEIGQVRGKTHGDAVDNMTHTAGLWASYLRFPISSADVAMMMSLLKASRIKCGTSEPDHFIDSAGYIAIAAQCSNDGRTPIAPYDDADVRRPE